MVYIQYTMLRAFVASADLLFETQIVSIGLRAGGSFTPGSEAANVALCCSSSLRRGC